MEITFVSLSLCYFSFTACCSCLFSVLVLLCLFGGNCFLKVVLEGGSMVVVLVEEEVRWWWWCRKRGSSQVWKEEWRTFQRYEHPLTDINHPLKEKWISISGKGPIDPYFRWGLQRFISFVFVFVAQQTTYKTHTIYKHIQRG